MDALQARDSGSDDGAALSITKIAFQLNKSKEQGRLQLAPPIR